MVQPYDVAIVGGGIIGLSCGYYLAKRKKRVVVLEAGGFGDGASGACDDMILLQSKKPGINLELAIESLELYRALRSELQDDLGFANYGGMVLIRSQQELRLMEEFVQQQRSYGLEVEILDEKEMHKRQPFISRDFIASTYSSIDAQADPFAVMHAFERTGRELGMTVRRQTPVLAIACDRHGDFLLTTPKETYLAPQVINAAGAWANQVASLVGLHVPITPKRGQIVITEKIPPVGQTNLWSAKYLVTKLKEGVEIPLSEEEQELGLGFAFTRSAGDTYLIGSTREEVGYDKQTTLKGIRALVRQAVSFIPLLAEVNFIRVIAGLRPATPDGKMILGEHENLHGFYTAAGHEGDGISLAPITGKLMASILCDGKKEERLNELSPSRFRDVAKEVC